MRSDVATTPGWYGKLPTLGDFASRRLEDDFVEPWDLWLAGALQAQRNGLGEAWLDAYRRSPPWRFLLTPGVIGGAAAGVVFAGVLVPSADRVGRHFPLTLAASLPAVPTAAADIEALLGWLHRLEDTALDAVQSGWGIDDLEAALALLAPPRAGAASAEADRLAAIRRALAAAQAAGGGFVDIGGQTSRADLASVFASALGASPLPAAPARASPLDRLAVFIADVPGRPQLLVSVGLPRHDDFARMFGGDGGEGGIVGTEPLDVASAGPAATSTTDVLALFDSEATLPPSRLSAYAGVPDDDIFALLNAGAAPLAMASASITTTTTNTTAPDDILALFSAPADGMANQPAEDGEPDILDLFGGPAVEAGPDKPA